jgi:hypothetical protein
MGPQTDEEHVKRIWKKKQKKRGRETGAIVRARKDGGSFIMVSFEDECERAASTHTKKKDDEIHFLFRSVFFQCLFACCLS